MDFRSSSLVDDPTILSRQLKAYEREYGELLRQKTEADLRIAALHDESKRLTSERDELASKLARSSMEVAILKKQLRNCSQESGELVASKDAEIARLRGEISRLEKMAEDMVSKTVVEELRRDFDSVKLAAMDRFKRLGMNVDGLEMDVAKLVDLLKSDDNKFVKRRIFQKGGRVIKVGDGSTRRSKWDPEESLCLLNACLLDKKSGKVQRRWNEIVKFMHAYHWNECTVENVGDRYRHLKAIYTAWTQIMLHVSGCAWDEQKGVYNFSPDQQRAFKQRFSHSRYTDICKGIPPTGLNIMVELWGDKVATGEYELSPALVDGSSPNHRSTNNPDISRNDKEQMSQPSDSEPLDEGSGESNEARSTDPISESRSSSTTRHTSSGNKRKSTDTPVNHQIEYSVELAKQSTEYFKLAKQSTEYFKLRQAERDRSHERARRLYSEVQARLFSHPYTVGRGPRYCTGVMRKLKENNKQEEFLDTRDEFLQSWLEWEFDDTNIM